MSMSKMICKELTKAANEGRVDIEKAVLLHDPIMRECDVLIDNMMRSFPISADEIVSIAVKRVLDRSKK